MTSDDDRYQLAIDEIIAVRECKHHEPTGDEPDDSCRTCKYWSGSNESECRRRAPVFDPDLGTRWPTTFYDQWCGEYKKKES